MQLLLPLILSSALVAAAPAPRPAVKTVYVTAYEYVEVPATQATPAPVPEPEQTPAYVAPQPQPQVDASADKPQTANVKVSNKEVSTTNYDSSLARMSNSDVNAIYKTCWNGQLQWPLPNTLPPCLDQVASQLSLYPVPSGTANTLTVNNYCGYPIYYKHFGASGVLHEGTLAPGGNFAKPLSGTVFKASKTADMARDVLIEYASDGNLVYYDLSLITCLGSTNGLPNSDTSACAGHEGGLQLGNKEGKSFQCAPGAWCDDQAYLYQENLCKKQNPVSACAASHGLTMEFCASMKH